MNEENGRIIEFKRPEPERPPAQPAAVNLPPITKIIIAGLIAIFAVDWLIGELTGLRWIASYLAFYGLAADPLAIAQLFTYALIHNDLAHLAMNIVGIAVLGKVLEPAIGAGKMFMLLAIGSAAGAIVQIGIGGPTILIGISAGVGALYGVALPPAWRGYFGRLDRAVIILALFFLATSLFGLVTGFLGNIAHAAHIGGLLAGLLLSAKMLPLRAGP